jgi:hypothetical protein
MGAWGFDSFDNDTACDWTAELEEAEDLAPVHEALDGVIENDEDYLDSDDACNAIAACEVLARLKGNWGKRDAYSEDVDRWVEAHPIAPDAEVIAKANTALDRILGEDSELRELWEETDFDAWKQCMDDLRRRVNA